jgi:hypothetical protein
MKNLKLILVVFCFTLLAGCSDTTEELNKNFGEAQVRERIFDHKESLAKQFSQVVKPVIENRCVVCHGCYDAPCQLKMSSPEGIDRGFSPEEVYATRFSEIEPTRLFIDAKNTQEWRDKEMPFKPVLNERNNEPVANLEGSVFYKMLTQKQAHPLSGHKILPDSFDVSLSRSQTCPSIEDFDEYQDDFPLGGMPYGLPAINNAEFKVLEDWLRQGAIMSAPESLSVALSARISEWEMLLNGSDNKSQLISRYIYEHLFLGHVYFSEEKVDKGQLPVYFRLVRSKTPSGEPIDEIATRRPYEDPKVSKVYYRLRQVTGTILTKTHMPYALNKARKARWNELFYQEKFTVSALPVYEKINNAFKVYNDIPANARYKFMLDDAQFFIEGFIKGPSCRGQTALNLIHDKFWVFFIKPDLLPDEIYNNFLYQQADNLELPSDFSVENFARTSWNKYSESGEAYLEAQKEFVGGFTNLKEKLNLDNIWTGNENSALTIFRNSDSGVVKKGLLGESPKTAWLIDYPVFERIHYLLVAGFDIYSPVRHQLITRLYMDFLRIEGEMAFITLLPKNKRKAEIESWYLDSSDQLDNYLTSPNFYFSQENSVIYKTNDQKKELFARLNEQNLAHLSSAKKQVVQLNVDAGPLIKLNQLPNVAVQQLEQTSFILLDKNDGSSEAYTLMRHDARKNVSTLLLENKTRMPELDSAEIYQGYIGSYPQRIFRVTQNKQTDFVKQFLAVSDEQSYNKLLDRFAIRRTSADFWQVSDKIHQVHKSNNAIIYGLFDYNRLVNK